MTNVKKLIPLQSPRELENQHERLLRSGEVSIQEYSDYPLSTPGLNVEERYYKQHFPVDTRSAASRKRHRLAERPVMDQAIANKRGNHALRDVIALAKD